MNCVNKNSPEFKELAKAVNMNETILGAKVSIWQDKNGLDKFPSVDDIVGNETEIKPGGEDLFNENHATKIHKSITNKC